MDTRLHEVLEPWGNYYLITGGAAAALTGLQFVVQTLLSSETLQFVTKDDPEGGIAAFGSPTVVHFAIALVLSCLLCAPWSSVDSLRLVLLVLGVTALVYAVVMLGRTLRQKTYEVTAYDWSWYVALPAVAYVLFTVSAVLFERAQALALDGIAIATLMLICIGIHNAWDTVTYLTIMAVRRVRDGNAAASAPHGQPNRRKHARRGEHA